jgi:cell division septation protein DedD
VGPDDPTADNSTESGRALNRRVTIELTEKETKTETETTTSFAPSNYNTFIERNVGHMIFTDGNLFCFQIAAFRTREKAENEAIRFLDASENAFIVESYLSELEGAWYKVRIGFFNTINEAREQRKRFVR